MSSDDRERRAEVTKAAAAEVERLRELIPVAVEDVVSRIEGLRQLDIALGRAARAWIDALMAERTALRASTMPEVSSRLSGASYGLSAADRIQAALRFNPTARRGRGLI